MKQYRSVSHFQKAPFVNAFLLTVQAPEPEVCKSAKPLREEKIFKKGRDLVLFGEMLFVPEGRFRVRNEHEHWATSEKAHEVEIYQERPYSTAGVKV